MTPGSADLTQRDLGYTFQASSKGAFKIGPKCRSLWRTGSVVLLNWRTWNLPQCLILPSRRNTTQGNHQKTGTQDFPGGPVVENPPANAGDTGLILHLGRSHKPWGNSPCAATTEPMCLEPVLCNEKPPRCKAQPLQLEKAHEQQRRPSAAKYKQTKYSIKKKKRKQTHNC